MVEVLINQFGFEIGLIIAVVGTILYLLRTRADTSSHVQKTESNTEKTYADALLMLARNGEASNAIARDMVSATREANAELRGMIAMLDTNTKATRATAMSVDELNGVMPGIRDNISAIHSVATTLETNIGESMKDQLEPVVVALIGIDTGLKKLSLDSENNHNRTNNSLLDLIALFQEARGQFMKAVEPIVLRHIVDFIPVESPLTPETPNGIHTLEPKSEEPKTP